MKLGNEQSGLQTGADGSHQVLNGQSLQVTQSKQPKKLFNLKLPSGH